MLESIMDVVNFTSEDEFKRRAKTAITVRFGFSGESCYNVYILVKALRLYCIFQIPVAIVRIRTRNDDISLTSLK